MAQYKYKQSGAFISGITKVRGPLSDLVVNRTESNSGTVSSLGTGGVGDGGDTGATVSGDDWFLTIKAFSEFDLSGFDSNDVTSAKLRYALDSNSYNPSHVSTVSAYTYNYGTLTSSTWLSVNSSTPSLGNFDVAGSGLVREIAIPVGELSGSIFQIATIHDILRDLPFQPANNDNVLGNISNFQPQLVLSGSFAAGFATVNNIGVQ